MGPSGVPSRAGGSVPIALRAFQGRIIGRRYYLLPTNFAFGTWVARLIAAPLNQRATKASALPKNQKFSGAPRFYLPIRGQFQSPSRVPFALRRVIITFKKIIQIDGAIGADDLHLAHDIPYALGSVRCVVWRFHIALISFKTLWSCGCKGTKNILIGVSRLCRRTLNKYDSTI